MGARLHSARQFAAGASTAASLIAGAFSSFSAAEAPETKGASGGCEGAAGFAVSGLADRAVAGRAAARLVRGRETVRGRAFAGRAGRKGRGELAGAARRAAILLVRRGPLARRRELAGETCARQGAGRVQHDHARDRRAHGAAAAAAARRPGASGRCAIPEIARRKTSIRHGSRSCSTRRSMQTLSWPALHEVLRDNRAISCSTIWVSQRFDEDGYSPRLRRPAILPARLFRIQDGAAVRILEVHARRRRPGPEGAFSGGTFGTWSRSPRRAARLGRDAAGPACSASSTGPLGGATCPADQSARRQRPPGLAPGFGCYLGMTHRRRRPFRQRAHRAGATRITTIIPCRSAGDAAPGAMYADPYGHVLVLVKRVPQSDGAAGVLLAVDGQPDGTSRASASGAAISCSRRIPRSAARVQALPPGRARQAAACGG